jgi:hypothetical protein
MWGIFTPPLALIRGFALTIVGSEVGVVACSTTGVKILSKPL